MNASFRRMYFTLGSVALIALAAGCAKERRQPAAPVGRTPTFESQLPADHGAHPSDQRPSEGTIPPGPGMPSRPGEGRAQEDHGAAGETSERGLCDALSQRASLSAENIPGGVQITATPRAELDTELRQLLRQIDAHLTAIDQPGQRPNGEMSSRCLLFDMVRTGARGRVVEGPDSIRIAFTSEDTAGVPIVRHQAQMFVQSAGESRVR